MSDENQSGDEEVVENLVKFVTGEMKAGSDKATIAAKLQEMGIERTEAEEVTSAVYDQIAASVEQEKFTTSAIGPGLFGGILGALVGGGVWAGIAILTDYEVGVIAWGIGGLCGTAVVMFAQGRKGLPLQLVAVTTSVLGIVVGKYFTFYYFLKQALIEEYGEEGVAELSVLGMDTMQFFIEKVPEMLSGFDALWVLLAVITAWSIPKGSGINLKSPPPPSAIREG